MWFTLSDVSLWRNGMPEDVPVNYRDTIKKLVKVRKRLKNPVSLKGELRPLMPTTIRQLESQERDLLKTVKEYRTLIKYMIKYNLLPLSKLISGEDRKQFIFTLGAMIEFPFFSSTVYFANQIAKRYPDRGDIPEDETCLLLIESLRQAIEELRKRRPFYKRSKPQSSKAKNSNDNVYSLADYR